MRLRMWVWVCWLGMAPWLVWGQSEKDALRGFEQSVIQQPHLFLRNFDASAVVKGRWSGSTVAFEAPFARMRGSVLVDAVTMKGDRLDISGRRTSVVWDRQVGFTAGPAEIPVRIEVDLGGADRKTVFVGLRDALFFTSEEAGRAAIPRNEGGTGPVDPGLYTAMPMQGRVGSSARTCDCAGKGTEACRGKYPTEGLTPLRVLRSAEPQFSQEARRVKRGGDVTLSLVVDGAGRPGDFWIVKPMGLGLDEKAVEAVQQYSFQPAACHDAGVKSAIHIDVNFQIF